MPPIIHESAIVSKGARIGEGSYVGPYSIIGDEVELGPNVRLESHVVIEGKTAIGEETRVFPFVSIGLQPQDLKYEGEDSVTRIGSRNQIREFVTIHRGTTGGGGETTVGDDNLLMAQAHVAHDCVVGNGIIMANGVALAGHVRVDDFAYIGAYTGIHQFCTVGRESFIGGYSMVAKDVMPFSTNQGNHARCFGLNSVGLKRRGYSKETLRALRRAFRLLLKSQLNTTQAVETIREELGDSEQVRILLDYIANSERGVVK